MDENTWFWKKDIRADGVLISYDVLQSKAGLLNPKTDIKKFLGFNGFVIIDSGAFGSSVETDPIVVYETQKRLNPDIAILLDKIPAKNSTPQSEKKDIDTTLKNASIVKRINRGKIFLMAVVQGNDIKKLEYCAKNLAELNFKMIGIPLSGFSKHRQYEAALMKVAVIKKYFKKGTILHALGCGSRTLIAILSSMGVRFFDSSSFYKAAMMGEAVKEVTFCSVNKPNSKIECKTCLKKQSAPKNFTDKSNYNLREIFKEVQRCRCAIDLGLMDEYLQKRLSKYVYKKIRKHIQ